jgi:type IV secretion system protein VirB11
MSATLDHLLIPLLPFWDEPGVEEICIQRPYEAWIWKGGKFERREVAIDADDVEDLIHVAAAQRHKEVSERNPLFGDDLPREGRLQAVVFPCVSRECPAIAIRIGDEEWPELIDYEDSGFFKRTRNKRKATPEVDLQLAQLFHEEKWAAFFHLAVSAKKNIIGCGQTASGKTRFSKALIKTVPLWERMITMEDAPELKKLPHPNRVMYYYNKHAKGDGDGLGPTPVELVETALRMRIGRLFLQEIRDALAAKAFLNAAMSGATGAITTVHASSPVEVFDRLRVILKETPAGAAMSDDDVTRNLQNNIDVVCHFDRMGDDFWMSEVWFKPVSLGEIP